MRSSIANRLASVRTTLLSISSLPVLAGLGLSSLLLAISVFGGCMTDDPRAGTRAGGGTGSGGSSSSSSSGGVDANVGGAPIDCGAAPANGAPFSKQGLLAAASDCAAWHACSFRNAATTLRERVRAESTTDPATREASRSAWKAAMDAWSSMELFQFGPIASKTLDPYHGRGLRSFVHPWPQTSRCEVERQVVTKPWQSQGIETVLPAGRGLYALEYLLFYPGADTACLSGSPTGQAWGALSASDLASAKGAYASAVADNLVALALEVHNVWLPSGEDFKSKLAVTYQGYGSDQEALNVVGWSLFYLEKDIKDLKVAVRAGVDPGEINPETPFALVEIENIRTNLRAFQELFRGCGPNGEGLGFEDWLVASNLPDLAAEVASDLAHARAVADAFPPFQSATQAQFKQLYDALRPLAVVLKTRLFGSGSPLNLKLPAGTASDTD